MLIFIDIWTVILGRSMNLEVGTQECPQVLTRKVNLNIHKLTKNEEFFFHTRQLQRITNIIHYILKLHVSFLKATFNNYY